MSRVSITRSKLDTLAATIATKSGASLPLTIDQMNSAVASIQPGGGTYQAKTNISPTTSSQTITPDSGYDALSSVQINAMPSGTAGTPSAAKGTVSNHSVSVTPSVTNTTGYITGGTKTGTAVTVSVSELESGTKSITANGTGISVSGYSTVDVAVPTGGGGMNVQAYIGQTTKANQTYEATDLTLTVAKTGTYKVSWDGYRSSTSGTNGSRLYINSTAQTAYTTFDSTNTRWQHVEMTNVSLSANDVITVYCRARSASYYMTVANLVIVQTA